METRYYTAQTILKEALCNNCGKMLKYVKSDFSRKDFCWLHWCEKCNKKYWLNNRYPLVDYLVDPNTPLLQLPTDPIPFEEGTEKAFASLGFTGFCNPCYMPCVEWINGKPYYPAYAARDALEKRIAELKAQNEEIKNELLDAKRDACRFEKAMYRALFNWAHVRTFVYMKEHGMLPLGITPDNLNVPNQWRRALDLCKLGYDFAKTAQDELPKKTKAPEAKR